MTASQRSMVRDIGLHASGEQKIAWVKAHMPLLRQLEETFQKEQPFAGKRIGMCLHLEAKTAYLALVIQAGGAEVAIAGSNPLSTQDDVAAALAVRGVHTYAWHKATANEYNMHLQAVLDSDPVGLIDDGADLATILHRDRPEQAKRIAGGCEETTTGIVRLRAMANEGILQYPMLGVNDALCKHLFDNRYGTGQSVWDGFMRTTNLVIAGKIVVVVGYGWCGRGVAARARGLGAQVIVCEVDPIRAVEAAMEGYAVMPLLEAAAHGDIFITVTGNKYVIHGEAMKRMKDGAILGNAGHFDVEVSKPDLEGLSVSVHQARPNIDEYRLQDGRRLYLIAEGRLVNLAAGDGHPAEVMDMTFALQALGLREVLTNNYAPGLHRIPEHIDREVAQMRLRSWGIEIDQLTLEQKQYLDSWL
ncbi:adenosylhomocysteinase [Alicyclobacillus hesperidum subsp. aegles]|uniref:adenosylhomocysteinase n=1 Tax=Alicyclobacillus hesperidum TaxID=89784 RepID=UPI0007191D86|nr:adenosylhomocysteinase [Alicyclobacillus hesperidum]KRW92335.1 S-adenosyl-L-homocysteine hydrolase [Alicyclobacillus tengchongensis]GLG02122.1 adenosylhomocysteinase [Alicyclobacillus hesperidum subsp. aegles]